MIIRTIILCLLSILIVCLGYMLEIKLISDLGAMLILLAILWISYDLSIGAETINFAKLEVEE